MKLLEEMSWPQIEAGLKETQTVILPVGATEEHGPHLPTMTDTIQAMEVARAVAKERHVFLAPPLHYGVCRSTRGFPGTITVGHDALRAFAKDLLTSFADSGFARVMILTGHAGGQHMAALEEACQMAVEERDFHVSLVSLFDLIDARAVETAHDGHAGEMETSLMMVIRPDLVKGKPAEHFPKRPQFLIMKDVRHLMGNGIMGNPEPATLEKGKQFFQIPRTAGGSHSRAQVVVSGEKALTLDLSRDGVHDVLGAIGVTRIEVPGREGPGPLLAVPAPGLPARRLDRRTRHAARLPPERGRDPGAGRAPGRDGRDHPVTGGEALRGPLMRAGRRGGRRVAGLPATPALLGCGGLRQLCGARARDPAEGDRLRDGVAAEAVRAVDAARDLARGVEGRPRACRPWSGPRPRC